MVTILVVAIVVAAAVGLAVWSLMRAREGIPISRLQQRDIDNRLARNPPPPSPIDTAVDFGAATPSVDDVRMARALQIEAEMRELRALLTGYRSNVPRMQQALEQVVFRRGGTDRDRKAEVGRARWMLQMAEGRLEVQGPKITARLDELQEQWEQLH